MTARTFIKPCRGAAVAWLALLPATAFSQEQDVPAAPAAVNFQLQASENYTYDSNPLRLVRNNKALSGSDTSVTLGISDKTQRSEFSSQSVIDQGIYDNSDFNSTNFHEKANIATHNQRWAAHLSGNLNYDTTRTSEITTYGINIPSVRHLGITASPGFDFKPTATEKWSLNSSITRSTYDNTAFQDYNFYSVTPEYNLSFDPINTGVITLNADRYETKSGTKNQLDSIGPSIGWIRVINQNMTARLTAGAEESRQDSTATTPSSSRLNYVFSGNLTLNEESDHGSIFISRKQEPFGNGSSALFTVFRASDTHMINERLSVQGSASYRYTDYLRNTGVNLDDEIAGSGGLSYRILRNADITANYHYIRQTLTNSNGTVKEHLFSVGLTYHPDPWGL